MSLSPSLKTEPNLANDEIDPEREIPISNIVQTDEKEPFLQIEFYCGEKKRIFGNQPKLDQEIELKEVNIQFSTLFSNQYQWLFSEIDWKKLV